ncbi:methyl-accepting chemotaxis protein [Shewanella sp. CAL98-MNA-CIBAN-0140]|uniref:methyl-accepting chemotaxis protein n=1 Tax=Shewanella sp. CAL98-MNA-CIBAN-0140 TaxID=3140462 RepID=UPI003334365C
MYIILWSVIPFILVALLVMSLVLSRRNIRHLQIELTETSDKLDIHQQQIILLENEKIKASSTIQMNIDHRSQLLVGLNILFEEVSDLEILFSEQMSTVNNALSRVSQDSLVSQHSGEQALESVELGHEGLPKLNKVLSEFSQMDKSLQELRRLIQNVSSHSDSIDRIAAESRILSINASIEAARAGTQGRGFAVVAGSVTDLAEKSASSAGQINSISQEGETLLKQLLTDSTDVIKQTEGLLGSFGSVYAQIEKSMGILVKANKSLQNGFIDFQSTYEGMDTSSKTAFESLLNELSAFVAQCNGTELVDLTVAQTRAGLDSYDFRIDVRRPDEYNDNLGHIAGTININIQADDFEKKLEQLDNSKNYLWICRSGGRSKRAAVLALRKGFTGQCHNMLGGMLAWNEASYPTDTRSSVSGQ